MNSTAPITSIWEVRLPDGTEAKMSLMELDHAFEEGAIDTKTMVREHGKGEWEPLGHVAGLDGEKKKEDDEDPPASAIETTAPREPTSPGEATQWQRWRRMGSLVALGIGAAMFGAVLVATVRLFPARSHLKQGPAAAAAMTVPPVAPPQEAVFIGPPLPPVIVETPSDHTPPAEHKPAKKKHTKGKVRGHAKHH